MRNYIILTEYSVINKLKSVNTMEYKYTLAMLPLNKSAVICSVECKENLKNRIFDLGIIENAVITPICKSPLGDPTAYLVKNAVIALRKGDCNDIYVSPI